MHGNARPKQCKSIGTQHFPPSSANSGTTEPSSSGPRTGCVWPQFSNDGPSSKVALRFPRQETAFAALFFYQFGRRLGTLHPEIRPALWLPGCVLAGERAMITYQNPSLTESHHRRKTDSQTDYLSITSNSHYELTPASRQDHRVDRPRHAL